jgi:excisionase family DNA binding protein
MLNISTIQQDVVVADDEVQKLTHALEELPEHSPLRDFVSGLLDAVSRGAGVSLVEQDKELSPNDVASLLQVSRPHVMKMIHAGILSAHPVGKHYRVMFSDFRDFADRRDRASKHVAEVIDSANKRIVPALDDEAMENLRQL